MANLQDWIPGFLRRHKARYAPPDFPAEGSDDWFDYLRLWTGAFAAQHVSEDEADFASERLASKPPRWRREHIPAVLAEVAAARPSAHQAAASDDRAEAAFLSRDCRWCGGSGLTTAFHPQHDGSGCAEYADPLTGEIRKFRTVAAAHCSCALGRWIRANTEPELNRRLIDLTDLKGWSLDDPEYARFERDFGAIRSVVELRAFVRSVGGSSEVCEALAGGIEW